MPAQESACTHTGCTLGRGCQRIDRCVLGAPDAPTWPVQMHVLRLQRRCALHRSCLTPLRSCPRRPLVRDPTPVRWQAMWRPPTQAAHPAAPQPPRCPAALLGSSSGLPGVPGQPGTSEAWTALSQSGGFEKPLQPPPTLDRRAMPGLESGAGHLRQPLCLPGGRGQVASRRGPQHCCRTCQQGSPRGLPERMRSNTRARTPATAHPARSAGSMCTGPYLRR